MYLCITNYFNLVVFRNFENSTVKTVTIFYPQPSTYQKLINTICLALQNFNGGVSYCLLFGKFGVLCFLPTPVLRFALLPYCWRNFLSSALTTYSSVKKGLRKTQSFLEIEALAVSDFSDIQALIWLGTNQ